MNVLLLLLALPALGASLVVGVDATTVQATVDLAQAGDRVVLPPGDWPGPVRIDQPITITSDGGVLTSAGTGHTLVIAAPHTIVDGLILRGSGTDLSTNDACIRLEPTATGAIVRNSQLSECLFGIWVHTTARVRLEDNVIGGLVGVQASRKGNGIQLFDASDLIVRNNTVQNARDGVYVSATDNSLIEGNKASYQRYGIHYMYSHHNIIRGNVATHNSGGIALMQSHDLVVEDNISTDNAKQGILFRDAVNCRIAHNTVDRNGEGFFFFSSVDNQIIDNHIAGNGIGARIWAGTERNIVRGNQFIGNRQQVFYIATVSQLWDGESGGNYWSDYLGWDQDRDGYGDTPYRVDSLVAGLLFRTPAAVLLLNSPTLELLSRLQHQLPALSVPTITDATPLMAPKVTP
ncbi:MAG: nitrous oxide reductase family maturation protein NosD [Oligoflexia bacterium]|nr:nitrous oxide reductase family maturation protein NosD [Oligoflexia bacterium]